MPSLTATTIWWTVTPGRFNVVKLWGYINNKSSNKMMFFCFLDGDIVDYCHQKIPTFPIEEWWESLRSWVIGSPVSNINQIGGLSTCSPKRSKVDAHYILTYTSNSWDLSSYLKEMNNIHWADGSLHKSPWNTAVFQRPQIQWEQLLTWTNVC